MKYVNCNVCGADNWFVRYPSTLRTHVPRVEAFRCTTPDYGEHTQIVQCAECAHIYSNPTWDADDLLEAYTTVEDETYVTEREGRELTFEKHLNALERFTGAANGRTLLDVGAYIGVFVETAQNAGWRAVGVEPSEWAVQEAKKRNLCIINGTLDAPELVGKTFDVLTMWDVIEHLDDPRAELEKSFAKLKSGGLIAVHTMNVESLTARLMGSRWPWLMEMHVQFFGKHSLSRLMADIGFDILEARTEGRYLRMGYLASRLQGFNKPLGKLAQRLVDKFGWEGIAVPINFGDLFTVYAVRP